MTKTIEEMVAVLDEVARRGFLSAEVKSRWSDRMTQYVTFTSEERQAVKEFCAAHVSILRGIDYPMSSFFGEAEQRTASLLQMLQHMLGEDTDPEYVAANAQRLAQAADRFNVMSVADLEKLL